MLNWILLYCITSSDGKNACDRVIFSTRQECVNKIEQLKTDGFKVSSSMCYSEAKR